jgi:hypothetical protein
MLLAMRLWLVIAGGLVLAASPARAQVAGPPGTPAAPGPSVPSTVDPGTLEDANSGRVAIMPTALTPPAGTFSFEDWELFLVSVSYAVTDQLVITGTTMIPVTDQLYWGFLSAKLQVLRAGRLRLAAQAGVLAVTANGDDSSDSTSAFDLGGVATLCLDDGCFSHLDGAVAAGFAQQGDSSVPVGFMGGLVAKVGRHVRLVAEADTAHMFGDISGQANGLLAWYGLRFTSSDIGVDLELVKPLCGGDDCDSSAFPLGFPFVTFSYRSM